MIKRFWALVLAAVLLLTASGCGKDLPAPTETLVAAMDTEMTLRLYGDTDNSAAEAITEELQRLDGVFSPTREDSVLYSLNRFKLVQDKDIASLLTTAQELQQRTEGALDVTLLPLSRLWGFIGDAYCVPTDAQLTETLARTGADKYTVTEQTVTLQGDAELDFGALAKGYAADRCRIYLTQANIPALLSLGGNIQTVGTKPDGTDWSIGIQDPAQPGVSLLTLAITGTKSIVTAGDYQRYFEYEGTTYCHIIDPATGSPVQKDLRSVTIVADNATLADGLSTALFVMGFEKAVEHWRTYGDFEAVLVEKSGTVWVTEGLQESVLDGDFTVITR